MARFVFSSAILMALAITKAQAFIAPVAKSSIVSNQQGLARPQAKSTLNVISNNNLTPGKTVNQDKKPSRHLLSFVRDWISLIRLRLHQSYMGVIMGATIFNESNRFSAVLAKELVVQYFLFFWCLYGGVYIVNALSDASLDALHPIKCKRPIPDGRISQLSAVILVVMHWTAAYALSFLRYSSTKFWPSHTMFIMVNLMYSLWIRRTRFRFMVGITAALRIRLGALIAGAEQNVPPLVYLSVFFLIATLNCIKFRLEATGTVHYQQNRHVKEAPLELILGVCAPVTTLLVFKSGASNPSMTIFGWVTVAFYCIYALLPAAWPRKFGCLIGAYLQD